MSSSRALKNLKTMFEKIAQMQFPENDSIPFCIEKFQQLKARYISRLSVDSNYTSGCPSAELYHEISSLFSTSDSLPVFNRI